MKVVFSDRAYAAVLAETTEKIKTETGGLFLGVIERDTWYIVETIDPGPKSIFEVAYFEYDQQYTQHLINKMANLYDEKLNLIGLWHRHPGSFDVFSGTDYGTNTKYAKMRPEGAISALVNIDPKFRLTVYHVGQSCRYKKIQYDVGNDLIPVKYLKLKTPKRYEDMMQEMLRPHKNRNELQPSVSLNSFMKTLKPLFEDRLYIKKIEKPSHIDEKIREKVVDVVLSDIMFMSDEIGIKMAVIQQNSCVAFVQDTVDGIMKVFFAYSEADNKFFFQYEGENYIYEEGLLEELYHMAEEKNSFGNQPLYTSFQGQFEHESRKIINGVFRLIKSDRNGD